MDAPESTDLAVLLELLDPDDSDVVDVWDARSAGRISRSQASGGSRLPASERPAMFRRPFTIPAFTTTALILAACGSSGSSSSSTSHAAAAAQPASATHSAAAAPYAAGAYGARTTAAAAPASERVTITAKHDRKLGMVLSVGARNMTVYMFRADHGTQSSCSGACASVWPPVTGHPIATGAALSAQLGTVPRSDGTSQVTYHGHPLYRYVKDGDAGDAYGAGITQFGAPWYALAPSGKVIDNS